MAINSASLPLPVKGLNSALPASQIDDGEMAEGFNFWLSPEGHFESRPGLTKLTTKSDTGSAIKGIYYSPANSETLVASGTKLYSYASNEVTEIGNLSGTNSKVHMLDFNGATYVASGGVLQVYNGTNITDCTNTGTNDVPPDARYLQVRRDRLFVACDTESSLYYSGSYDGGDWGGGDGADGGIINVRMNDGAQISGLVQVDGSLAVFKANLGNLNNPQPCSISLLVGETPTDFVFYDIREGTSVVEPHTISPVLNDVAFCGNGGVFTLAQVQSFDNPRSFPVSLKIRPTFRSFTPACACYADTRGYYIVVTNGYTFAYHVGMRAWFTWSHEDITMTYVANGGDDKVLFGSSDGHLYYLDDDGTTFDDDGTEPAWQFSTKAYDFKTPTAEKWFHKLYLTFQPLGGTGHIGVNYRKNTGSSTLGARSVGASTSNLAGWDGAFSWDTEGVGWDDDAMLQKGHMIRLRARNMQFQVVPTIPVRLVEWALDYEPFRRTPLSWK